MVYAMGCREREGEGGRKGERKGERKTLRCSQRRVVVSQLRVDATAIAELVSSRIPFGGCLPKYRYLAYILDACLMLNGVFVNSLGTI